MTETGLKQTSNLTNCNGKTEVRNVDTEEFFSKDVYFVKGKSKWNEYC